MTINVSQLQFMDKGAQICLVACGSPHFTQAAYYLMGNSAQICRLQ